MGMMTYAGIVVAATGAEAAVLRGPLYISMLRRVQSPSTRGLFAFLLAAPGAMLLETPIFFFWRRSGDMDPGLQGPPVAQAALLMAALIVLALTTGIPNPWSSGRRVVR